VCDNQNAPLYDTESAAVNGSSSSASNEHYSHSEYNGMGTRKETAILVDIEVCFSFCSSPFDLFYIGSTQLSSTTGPRAATMRDCPRAFVLEGSIDGEDWDVLHSRGKTCMPTNHSVVLCVSTKGLVVSYFRTIIQ